jgi:hypothetical protein
MNTLILLEPIKVSAKIKVESYFNKYSGKTAPQFWKELKDGDILEVSTFLGDRTTHSDYAKIKASQFALKNLRTGEVYENSQTTVNNIIKNRILYSLVPSDE